MSPTYPVVTDNYTYKIPPPEDRYCVFCRRDLERTGAKAPGVKTWRCPKCERVYSDVRVYRHHKNRGRTGPKPKGQA